MRYEIMDISGNMPFIRIFQSRRNPVTPHIANGVIKLKTKKDEVVVEIHVTGYVTDVEIHYEGI